MMCNVYDIMDEHIAIAVAQAARISAAVNQDEETAVLALMAVFADDGLDLETAREVMRNAIRERQELDISDTHDEIAGDDA